MELTKLAQDIGAQLVGPRDLDVKGINTIQNATSTEVCFLSSAKHSKHLDNSRAGAVIVKDQLKDCRIPQLVVDNVNRGLIDTLKIFAPKLTPWQGVHPSAVVESDAKLHESVAVGPNAYVGHNVRIGAHTVIGPGCSIGENSTLGSGCRLDSNVVVYHNCQIGNLCVIQANSTIGATGFGYSYFDGQHHLVPHNGGVVIDDGVEIGSNSCVDRAKFGNTRIGAGTKIDNFVQIAHNVQIGRLCLLAGHVGISGSTVIGDGVVFAGASGTADNVSVGDGVILGAQAVATKDVDPGKKLLGTPAQDMAQEMRCLAALRNLPDLAKEVKQLKRRVAELEAVQK
jgi:UDP-3-O-[3-hydroxymyristoyl] glucosamine N-acyltransferase